MISCEHWYYSQASYKGDHELSGYTPCEEGGGRDVNNDNSGACCRTLAEQTDRQTDNML